MFSQAWAVFRAVTVGTAPRTDCRVFCECSACSEPPVGVTVWGCICVLQCGVITPCKLGLNAMVAPSWGHVHWWLFWGSWGRGFSKNWLWWEYIILMGTSWVLWHAFSFQRLSSQARLVPLQVCDLLVGLSNSLFSSSAAIRLPWLAHVWQRDGTKKSSSEISDVKVSAI